VPRSQQIRVDLRGVMLPESRSRKPWDVGSQVGVHVLSLIRHRY